MGFEDYLPADGEIIRRIMGLPEGEAIPEEVSEIYCQYKRMWHRGANGPMEVQTLMTVVFLSGALIEKEPLDPNSIIDFGRLQEGQPLVAYRDDEPVVGKYVCKARKGFVRIDFHETDKNYREVPCGDVVSLIEKRELIEA